MLGTVDSMAVYPNLPSPGSIVKSPGVSQWETGNHTLNPLLVDRRDLAPLTLIEGNNNRGRNFGLDLMDPFC